MGEVSLPRAITVTAALYSIGIPPEILGMNALTPTDIEFLKQTYVNFEEDLTDAVRYLNPESKFIPDGVIKAVEQIIPIHPDPEHQDISSRIEQGLASCQMESFTDLILQAGHIRKFLG